MPHAAFTGLVDLASEALGGRGVLSSDDFFAGMQNLVNVEAPIFKPDAYTDEGKWMDGWESRRRRVPGHDWCIVELGVRGRIAGVDIDTAHFLGNHPPYASIDACTVPKGTTPAKLRDKVNWTRIVEQVPLASGSHNYFSVRKRGPWTHLRLNIYPDGGVARLRVYGSPRPDKKAGATDLAAAVNGGRALACSDMFFGDVGNLLLPQRAETMGEGWESRRRRGAGNDWAILQLGTAGVIDHLEIDTNHFKGNFPDRCSVEGIYWRGAPILGLIQSPDWTEIMASTRMKAHTERRFPASPAGPYTHLRLNVFPCGGVSRFRAHGRAVETSVADAAVTGINDVASDQLFMSFHRCCGSDRWAEAMAGAHPFQSKAEMYGVAEHIWWHLDETDWKKAFSKHPEIGTDVGKIRKGFAATSKLSEAEQAGVSESAMETLTALAAANAMYRDQFGFVFIVCATGLSGEEILTAMRGRMGNSPENEIRVAAGEQAKITRLRLAKLL